MKIILYMLHLDVIQILAIHVESINFVIVFAS